MTTWPRKLRRSTLPDFYPEVILFSFFSKFFAMYAVFFGRFDVWVSQCTKFHHFCRHFVSPCHFWESNLGSIQNFEMTHWLSPNNKACHLRFIYPNCFFCLALDGSFWCSGCYFLSLLRKNRDLASPSATHPKRDYFVGLVQRATKLARRPIRGRRRLKTQRAQPQGKQSVLSPRREQKKTRERLGKGEGGRLLKNGKIGPLARAVLSLSKVVISLGPSERSERGAGPVGSRSDPISPLVPNEDFSPHRPRTCANLGSLAWGGRRRPRAGLA